MAQDKRSAAHPALDFQCTIIYRPTAAVWQFPASGQAYSAAFQNLRLCSRVITYGSCREIARCGQNQQYDTMYKHLLFAVAAAVVSVSAVSASEEDSSKEIRNTSVVESGTYQVVAKRVDAEAKEIYVTMEDGKILELYFSDATKLTQGGKDAEFRALKNGQKLEVQIEKDGNKLKPLAVSILE